MQWRWYDVLQLVCQLHFTLATAAQQPLHETEFVEINNVAS